MHWEDGQTLEFAEGKSVFAYVEGCNDPIELGDGWVTEDGFFWSNSKSPTAIISIMTGGLCTSYDEEPFNWHMFQTKGRGRVVHGTPVSFLTDRGTV